MLSFYLSFALIFSIFINSSFASEPVIAQTTKDEANTSESYTQSLEKLKVTPEIIMEKVKNAANLLKEKGSEAFPLFKGNNSEFLFGGTYIWIHNLDGIMLMHPIKYKMEGKRLISLKDIAGKRFFILMNKIAREKGEGWVSYLWPKPGDKKPSQKISFVKLCETDEENFVLGCGTYDLNEQEVIDLKNKYGLY